MNILHKTQIFFFIFLREVFLNPFCCCFSVWKYEKHELIGEPISKIISTLESNNLFNISEENYIFKMLCEKLKQVNFIKDIEVNYITKDNKKIPLSLSASVIKDARGKLQGFVYVARDITERKKIEKKLNQRREALEAVYKIAITLDRPFVTICDRIALNLARLLEVPYVIIQRKESNIIKIISQYVDGKITQGGIFSQECPPCSIVYEKKEPCQFKGSLKELFPENLCFSKHNFRTYLGVPIKTSTNDVVGIIAVMDHKERDFSKDEIHLIEIFAKYIAYEIERETIEAQLRRAHKMEILGKLAGGVAHEVRNPLYAILSITEALNQEIGNNPEYKPYIEHIQTQVDRLSRLMQDLLELGRPIEPTNLHRESLYIICTSAINLWKKSTKQKAHKVHLIQPSEPCNINVLADSSKLQQVFFNLLENAAQHSPEGSEIILKILKPEKNTIKVHITDQGSGIPPEHLSRVFEPFFTTRKTGTGLGLSIVRHIIESHGGNVTIWNNNPPPGCTVEISLPLAPPENHD